MQCSFSAPGEEKTTFAIDSGYAVRKAVRNGEGKTRTYFYSNNPYICISIDRNAENGKDARMIATSD